MLLVLFWIIGSLTLTSAAVIIGKKHGVSFLIAIYSALVVMANIFANKIVLFGPTTVPAGVIVYGISFLITDAINEFYGVKEAQKSVIAGFASSIILVFSVYVTIAWTPAPFWEGQEALATVLGSTWRIVLASLISFLVSQNWDVYFYHQIRLYTKGKHLWLRNTLSTLTSQLMDTILFCSIAFIGLMPLENVIGVMIGQLVVKWIISILDTPFIYLMRYYYEKVTSPSVNT